MTPDQIDMLFSTQLLTIQTIRHIAEKKYLGGAPGVCRIFVTRKQSEASTDDSFTVRPDDCLKIYIVRDHELALYKHGYAREVLCTLNILFPTRTETVLCSKCQQF